MARHRSRRCVRGHRPPRRQRQHYRLGGIHRRPGKPSLLANRHQPRRRRPPAASLWGLAPPCRCRPRYRRVPPARPQPVSGREASACERCGHLTICVTNQPCWLAPAARRCVVWRSGSLLGTRTATPTRARAPRAPVRARPAASCSPRPPLPARSQSSRADVHRPRLSRGLHAYGLQLGAVQLLADHQQLSRGRPATHGRQGPPALRAPPAVPGRLCGGDVLRMVPRPGSRSRFRSLGPGRSSQPPANQGGCRPGPLTVAGRAAAGLCGKRCGGPAIVPGWPPCGHLPGRLLCNCAAAWPGASSGVLEILGHLPPQPWRRARPPVFSRAEASAPCRRGRRVRASSGDADICAAPWPRAGGPQTG
jgi:hypothetical protein